MTKLFGRTSQFFRALGRYQSILISLSPRVVRSPIRLPNYSWIEVVPMLVILVGVGFFLALFPSCIDNGNCVEHVVRQHIDMELLGKAVLNNTSNLQNP